MGIDCAVMRLWGLENRIRCLIGVGNFIRRLNVGTDLLSKLDLRWPRNKEKELWRDEWVTAVKGNDG